MAVKHGPCLLTLKKRVNIFGTKRLRKLLRISYLEHKTNDWVRSNINFLMGPQEPLLATVRRLKPAWFGHVTRHDSLSKTILQGTLEGGRRSGRQRKCWMDNIKGKRPCPCQNGSQGPPAEKIGRGSLPNRLSCPHDDPIGQGTELIWSNSSHALTFYNNCSYFVVTLRILTWSFLFAVYFPILPFNCASYDVWHTDFLNMIYLTCYKVSRKNDFLASLKML